ncbi:protein of unknown function [Burkholderia multivorans]
MDASECGEADRLLRDSGQPRRRARHEDRDLSGRRHASHRGRRRQAGMSEMLHAGS